MKFKKLSIVNLEEILLLEEKMYWMAKKWHQVWKKEGQELFRNLIKDYLKNFPDGCFGLFNEKDHLLG